MSATTAPSTLLHLWSGDGPITRTVLGIEPRDALSSEMPIIDVAGIYSDRLADRAAVARQVHDACTNMGFFYIKNHGVPARTIDDAYAACLRFFRQPTGVKTRAISPQPDVFNGYHPAQTQRINPFESVDVRESFSWKYDPVYDPSVVDADAILADAAAAAGIVSDEFIWDATQNLPEFKPAVVGYWQACLRLARALVRCFALSLGLDEDFFDAKFTYPDATFNVNYYPPMEKPAPSSAPKVSIGSHTDFQLFTILWQDQCGGLQVLNKQGQWLNAQPVQDTFVVNIADYLQRITNDLYVSTVHRAQNWSGQERISMPVFLGFNLSESCAVIDTCVHAGERKKYDEVSCREWVNRRSRKMHET